MRKRRQAFERVRRTRLEQDRLGHASDTSTVIAFGAGLHQVEKITACPLPSVAELAAFLARGIASTLASSQSAQAA
jgi:hypothetical protein